MSSSESPAPSAPPNTEKKNHLSLLDCPVEEELDAGDPVAPQDPYSDVIQQSEQWKGQLQEIRREMYVLQVKNAMLLDKMAMLGVDA